MASRESSESGVLARRRASSAGAAGAAAAAAAPATVFRTSVLIKALRLGSACVYSLPKRRNLLTEADASDYDHRIHRISLVLLSLGAFRNEHRRATRRSEERRVGKECRY